MASSKEANFFVLDIGKSMQDSLKLALESISWTVSKNIFSGSKSEFSLVLFGSDQTENLLSKDDPEQYKGVWVPRELQKTDFDLLKFIEREIKLGDDETDFLDALIVAAHTLNLETQGKKYAKKNIFLFSALGAESDPEQAETIANSLKKSDIHLSFVGPENEDSLSETQKENLKILEKILEIVDGDCYTFQESNQKNVFERRAVQPAAWKCCLEIGKELAIPVQMYLKVSEEKPKQSWKLSTQSGQVAEKERVYEKVSATPDQEIKSEESGETSQIFKQTQVDKEDLIRGYRFGKTIVPFTDEDFSAGKYEAEGKCFQLLAFTKRNKVNFEQITSEWTRTVLPDDRDEEYIIAFDAFVESLLRKDLIGVVRYAYRKGVMPKIGIIMPKRSKKGIAKLHFFLMPFIEDNRQFIFSKFPDRTEPTQEQREAISHLVDQMMLPEPSNIYTIRNPYLQYHYQSLKHKALNPKEPLPPPDPRFTKPLEISEEIFNKIEEELDKLPDLFSFQKPPEKRKRRKEQEPVTFDRSELQTSEKAEISPSPIKSMKLDPEASVELRIIGTVSPVEDFHNLLFTDSVQVSEVFGQFSKIIRQFVNSGTDRTRAKALECLKALREASIQNSEPTIYNQLLVDIRNQNPNLWESIMIAALSPISQTVCASSQLTDGEIFQMISTMKPEEEELGRKRFTEFLRDNLI